MKPIHLDKILLKNVDLLKSVPEPVITEIWVYPLKFLINSILLKVRVSKLSCSFIQLEIGL